MPGRIQELIDELVRIRSGGRPGRDHFVRAHLVLNGIDPDRYNASSADDPAVIEQLETMIASFKNSR